MAEDMFGFGMVHFNPLVTVNFRSEFTENSMGQHTTQARYRTLQSNVLLPCLFMFLATITPSTFRATMSQMTTSQLWRNWRDVLWIGITQRQVFAP
jgi:hypothetical protein